MNERTLYATEPDGTKRPVFTPYDFTTGRLDVLDRQWPSSLYAWDHRGPQGYDPVKQWGAALALELGHSFNTHYGYCHRGPCAVKWHDAENNRELTYRIEEGEWFVYPGMIRVSGGRGIVVTREGHRALPIRGGPLERAGRLKYIDGCTDSLLAAPVKKGDPCLNLLYFPQGIDQTAHTHPSDRIGMILSGKGLCVVGEGAEQATIDLTPGMIFCIHTGGLHKFATPYGEEMRVIAYHPDSDFGPTDEEHPMINRTMVDGVSASKLEEIHTR